ncbi:hypothetical protein LQ50_11920 [Halalkalibacter okhensis]|uniref:Uncharacterized protein n=1 Tax=Halalkalibacter okhensis TaxID=333138 RepID=A0A0B0IJZ4_9BACI|nr:hypothetical protein LQ50_11920 [Halalkalibacter okhensis]
MKCFIALLAWCIFFIVSNLLINLTNRLNLSLFISTSTISNVLSVVTLITIFILFGALLASPHLIKQYRIYGDWKLHLSKFIWLGISPVLLLLVLDMIKNEINAQILVEFDIYPLSILLLVICGYYSSQCLYKE